MDAPTSPTINKALLVCGSVHINIIAKARKQISAIKKSGSVIFDIGGTANNIAIAAKKLGLPVRILTSLPKISPYSDIISNHLSAHKIEQFIQHEKGLSDAAFCAHFDEDGHIASIISSNPIETVKFNRNIYESAMKDVDCCIIDSSLSTETIICLARYANLKNIPVFACVSSEETSERFVGIDVQFSGVFSNRAEMNKMAACLGVDPTPEAISRNFECPAIITRGGEGAVLARPDSNEGTHFMATDMGSSSDKDYMGAGDILAAHTVVHSLYGKRSLNDALSIAMNAAEEEAINRHIDLNEDGGRVGRAIQEINNAAALDHLTKLPNRATAVKKMQQLTNQESDFFVALVDIDHFKRVNDTFGHDAGDEALVLVAEAMSLSMREGDFCARWGGEEFLCIIDRGICGKEDARLAMERTREAVSSIKWEFGQLTVSIGITSVFDGFERAIKRADEAMYMSKKNGRNRTTAL